MTTPAPDTGLQDVVVSTSEICFTDGDQGRLLYRGYDIHDLVGHATFEEVTYLLWHGRLPARGELRGLNPNVDFYSASLYHVLGIDPDLYTPIFVVSRVSGWTAHILEQQGNNRLIRPRAEHMGPRQAAYVPINQR